MFERRDYGGFVYKRKGCEMRLSLIPTTILPIFLTGCVSDPFLVKEAVEVKVAVKVPCLEKPIETPTFPLDMPVSQDMPLQQEGYLLIKEIEERRDYEKVLESVVLSCTKLAEDSQ